ncbi:MAG TPA: N-acetylmuramoyl-L-alanine amidase [Candidatus Acidoferrales bacterium]|nr:N-acetylmuramoyl-L-alanine amidase [Candidatus Acidoferrales bacterium]
MDSGILVRVPSKWISLIFVSVMAAAQALSGGTALTQSSPNPGQSAPQTAPPATPPQTSSGSTQGPAQTPGQAPAEMPPPPPPVPTKTLGLVILDPAHGGADPGARGSTGIAESDVVLSFARLVRISLEAQGFRVVLTRQANEDPSFDDRSRVANAQRGNIFISLHISSTGQPGTVRVYSMPRMPLPQTGAVVVRGGLLPWDRAQFNFIDQSRRLAELLQIQMAQKFRGSSETPFEAAVRQLRTVGTPAVAIEVSSVSVPSRAPLDQMGPGLADGVARAVAAYKIIYESGGK